MARTFIITGAASGIGRALAGRLAARGDHLLLLDLDGPSVIAEAGRLDAIARQGGGSASGVPADVRDAQALVVAVEQVVADHGRLDVMVNNAGIGLGGPVEEMTPEHFQRVFDINISGVMHGTVAAYRQMVAQGSGQIVNIASLAGLIPAPFLTAYGASKHAVVGLSLSLAAEADGTGVGITCVCPGFTDTPILDFHGPDDLPRTSMAGRGRPIAGKVPGGVYDVQLLARDIEKAIDRRSLLVVTPMSARWLSRTMRISPRLGTKVAGLVARGTRRTLAERAPEAGPLPPATAAAGPAAMRGPRQH